MLHDYCLKTKFSTALLNKHTERSRVNLLRGSNRISIVPLGLCQVRNVKLPSIFKTKCILNMGIIDMMNFF